MRIWHTIGSLIAVLVLSGGLAVVTTSSASAATTTAVSTTAGNWPCSTLRKVRACVDLSQKRAWLRYRNSTTKYGPVPISSGMPGYRTPTGTFTVKFKDKDYWSQQYDGPMPYAVFFTNQGHAFHYGSVQTQSHGCVRLTMTPAKKFFWHLSVGDVVQIRA